ncbi:CRISPR-associated protein Csx16 [Chitinilyticum piscinae]|uniref:CRISPR-associated protein Csx16 n=1 Tax=Chitinilyticum piscinae TaxID=2866724 RepID=A0A8J7FME2_9NEIS|nr:CRISPR-associated protein Csx16 [Chitinilyticum piscinae]MBE9610817.1 CRISPR-associated protein Csx16 [Chitinilyticum piscinae]
MTIWFVSRHAGAIAWAKARGLPIDRWVTHLDVALIQTGDTVIGTLPVHLAGQVCDCGAGFYFLSLDVPEHWRGQELTTEQMQQVSCSLRRYQITPMHDAPGWPSS